MAPAGAEPTTFRFVAQHFNHCANAVARDICCLLVVYPDVDKSLARSTSRCRRKESIVSLEANLLLRSNNICLLQTVKNLQRDERQLICLICT